MTPQTTINARKAVAALSRNERRAFLRAVTTSLDRNSPKTLRTGPYEILSRILTGAVLAHSARPEKVYLRTHDVDLIRFSVCSRYRESQFKEPARQSSCGFNLFDAFNFLPVPSYKYRNAESAFLSPARSFCARSFPFLNAFRLFSLRVSDRFLTPMPSYKRRVRGT